MIARAGLVLLVGCTVGAGTPPSPEPPPPWGVPVTGGTMLVTRDGARAVIADPDRDRILVVALRDLDVAERSLETGAEPGRIVEDGAGRVHVALRGSGQLLTLDSMETRSACAEPRGLAWEPATDLVHLACATGELVSFPAAGGPAVRWLRVERDLRDVVIQNARIGVTTFRSAELLWLHPDGSIAERVTHATVKRVQPAQDGSGGGSGAGSGATVEVDATPAVAWRAITLPDGRILVAHQRKRTGTLRTSIGGYRSPCGQGPVESAISVVTPGGASYAVAPYVRGALPVDVAVDPRGGRLAFAVAGTGSVQLVATQRLSREDDDPCGEPEGSGGRLIHDELGAPTAVAFAANGSLLVFYPELPALAVHGSDDTSVRTIRLPGALGYDSGRAMFHRQTGAGIACASCHPEGREDGQVWEFADLGARRTQSVAGGILSRAPYHWIGDMTDLDTLMNVVFGQRMAGGRVTRSELLSLGPWLDRIPAPRPPIVDDDAVARGKRLFLSPQLGCIDCHSGPTYTNNQLADVGTGRRFKVPSLVGVGARSPYMHTGCALTLRDRFGPCGGGEQHGKTAMLSEAELADLVAYLESL